MEEMVAVDQQYTWFSRSYYVNHVFFPVFQGFIIECIMPVHLKSYDGSQSGNQGEMDAEQFNYNDPRSYGRYTTVPVNRAPAIGQK